MRRFLLFFLIFELAHCSSPQCPTGFDLVRNGECRGKYSSIEAYSDDVAKLEIEKCQEIHGYPISIHDAEDQSYWTGRIAQGDITVIGLVCNTTSKLWEWADGSTMNYKPPTYNSHLDKDCTGLYSGASWIMFSDGTWTIWSYSPHDSLYTDVFCIVQLSQPVPNADGCEIFYDDEDDEICYQVVKTAENWQEGQLICRSFGANAASIHNEKENSFIRRTAVAKGVLSGVYLGAAISGKGNDFGWVDGSAWDYDNYFPGFPMSGFGDCLMMNTSGSSGQWVNVDCSAELSVACMRQQYYTTPSCSSGPWIEGQIIYSPGYPFDSSTPCDFILSVDTGKKVELEVLSLEANLCCDLLIISEMYFERNESFALLSGEISDKKYTTTSSNSMKVSWLPNGGTNVKGAIMTFRGV